MPVLIIDSKVDYFTENETLSILTVFKSLICLFYMFNQSYYSIRKHVRLLMEKFNGGNFIYNHFALTN